MKNLFKLLPAVLVYGLCACRVFANGFALADQDAFAAARGDAFVATADNPSAIYYNPAGMAQLDGDNLRGGIFGIYDNSTYKPLGGTTTYNSWDHLSAVPQFFYVHSMNKLPLSFGLGVYFPYGGKIGWPEDTGFRPIAVSASLDYATINPAIAWKILPSLSIGGGPMINYVHLSTSQGYPAPQANGPANFFDFKGSGWSAGYNAGIRWQPIKQLAFGATFRSSAWVTLDGQTHYQFPPTSPNDSSANMSMDFPWTVVGGISYRPTPKWNLEFDANYTDWSTLETFNLYQQTPGPNIHQNPLLGYFDWQPSWIYEFGVTRYFGKAWRASAGYAYDENSVPNAHYTPFAADLDRHFFSLGVGFSGKVFNFDITYQLGYGPDRTVTGSQPPLQIESEIRARANGTYGFFSNAIMVSAGIHF